MNDHQTQDPIGIATSTHEATKSIVGTLLDLGAVWAAHGLHAGRFSLENGARALEKTAKSLETLARDLESKHAPKT